MKKSLQKIGINAALALGSILCLTSTSYAAYLDFTDANTFGAANNKSNYSAAVDGLGVTLQAAPIGAKLSQDSTDGLGIRYGIDLTPDQIEYPEVLTITFSESVSIDELKITDLFIECTGAERGNFRVIDANGNVVTSQQLAAVQRTGTNGELNVDLNGVSAKSIQFYGSTLITSEFSVAGITYNSNGAASVPELDLGTAGSSVAFLFGSALLLSARRRRS